MTMASQGESTFGVTKPASSELTVVAVSGPSPQPVSSGTAECGLLYYMVRLQCAAVRRACPSQAAICKGLDCLCDAGYLME